MDTIRCRAQNPLTCREHGAALARTLLLDSKTERDFGLVPDALDRYVKASHALETRLTQNELGSLGYYTGIGYSSVNGWLRNGMAGLIDAEIHDNYHHQNTPQNRNRAAKIVVDYLPRVEQTIKALDDVFKKSHRYDSPRVLYKAFRVRSATGSDVTTAQEIKEYVRNHYQVGAIVTNKAYTSTSLDPDYMLVHARRRPSQVIVHEIVTDKGLPLHTASIGSIQSAEREMLLPRNMKLEVVNITRATFAHSGLGPNMNHWGLPVPQRKRFTVIQFREVA